MSKLPQVSGADLVRALSGQAAARESHHLRRDNPFAQTVVPNHRQIDRGTLRAILRQSDGTVEQLLEVL